MYISLDALTDWPALSKWTQPNYLRSKLAHESVTIDRVPLSEDGCSYGDSVVGGLFVTPHEEQMKFGEFLDEIEKSNKNPSEGVLYCQHQNSSLTEEFSSLIDDAPELSWASEAFNAAPDAVNLWVGENRSISTLHHDPYENMYAVVTGTKKFLLYPPSDYHWLDKREYPRASWKYDPSTEGSNRFTVVPDPDGQRTAWFDLEPQGPNGCLKKETTSPSIPLVLDKDSTVPMPAPGPFPSYETHPPMASHLRSEHSMPIWVELKAGEVLYLPSLWFHRVAQEGDETGKTIAVNFWYDMSYDSRYTSFRFLEQASNQHRQLHGAIAPKVTTEKPSTNSAAVEPTPSPSPPPPTSSASISSPLPSSPPDWPNITVLPPVRRFVVGSKNQTKVGAVRAVVDRIFNSLHSDSWLVKSGRESLDTVRCNDVVGVETASGVGAQPLSGDETKAGALNRARAVLKADPFAEYGIGIEGGIEKVGDEWFECGWVAVIDRIGRVGIGTSARFQISASVEWHFTQIIGIDSSRFTL